MSVVIFDLHSGCVCVCMCHQVVVQCLDSRIIQPICVLCPRHARPSVNLFVMQTKRLLFFFVSYDIIELKGVNVCGVGTTIIPFSLSSPILWISRSECMARSK